jgi:hypothetical protein
MAAPTVERNVGLQSCAISREKSVSHLQFAGSKQREMYVWKERFIAECMWHIVTLTRKHLHVTHGAKVTINLFERQVSLPFCLLNVYKCIDFSQIEM